MELKPLGDRVLIEKEEAEEKSSGGVILPSQAKEQPQIAKVLAVGEEILNDEKKKDQVKVGDRVIFPKYSGTEIKLDGKELTIIKLNDLLAVIK